MYCTVYTYTIFVAVELKENIIYNNSCLPVKAYLWNILGQIVWAIY